MPNSKQQSLFFAGLAIAVLLLASFLLLNLIRVEEQRSINDHTQTTLKGALRLLQLHETDHLSRVRSIAENRELQRIVAPMLDSQASATPAEIRELEGWLTPIYKSRGFVGYSLIRNDHSIVSSTSVNVVGTRIRTTEAREALEQARITGAAMSRPTLANFPIHTDNEVVASGVIFHLACGRIARAENVLGYLCLRMDPLVGLYQLLNASRYGESGEAYLIDKTGRILTPSRFESSFEPRGKRADGWSTLRLWARTPPGKAGTRQRMPLIAPADLQQPLQIPSAPLTSIAWLLLRNGDVSYMENYADYRGRPVVGSARWINGLEVGLIVEQDLDEAYRSYFFTRYVILSMTACAILLIVMLTVHQLRSRRALASSEANFRAFVENVPAGVHIKDLQGRYFLANAAFERGIGQPEGSTQGKTDFDLMPREIAETRLREHKEVIHSRKTVSTVGEYPNPHGEPLVYRVLRFPILSPDRDEVVAVGSVGIEITEQIRIQKQLEEFTQHLEQEVATRTRELTVARDEAEHAMQVKSEFLANMSHEIRTPLNAIVGMSHLAARLNDDPKVQRYLERIQTSNQHLLNIVNDILDFSKIEAGKLVIEKHGFSLERMLEHVAGLVWEQADAKGLELVVHSDPDIPDQLVGDAMRIGQILINFSNNAIKFTEHGEVILRVRLIEKQALFCLLRFEVEDTGIGIAADKIGDLFQPFQQADNSLSRRFGGTGLGLAISKNLAGLMGGRVDVRSVEHQGSVFSLELSLDRTRMDHAPTPALPGMQGQSALVVDDNAQARRAIAAQLASLSLEVVESDSGQAAVDLVVSRDADDRPLQILFIDWKMPGLSGMETAQQIRMLSLKHAPPHLVLMAPSHEHQNVLQYAEGVVAKPVSPSALFDCMVKLLDPKLDTREHDAGSIDQNWSQLKGRTVLLVEDSEINQEVARDLLGIVGIEVIIANDGMEAMQKINMHRLDLVLMDVHMPIMDGFEATQAIRKDSRFDGLPIVAMTANAMEGDRERCLQAGMDDYIPKPLNPEQMFAAIARNLPAVQTPKAKPVAEDSPAPASAEDLRLLAALQTQPGLNTEQGLQHVLGRTDLYVKLVRRVLKERNDTLVNTLTAIEQGNLEAAVRYVHGFKAISGSIGAEALHQSCMRLEAELRARQVDPASVAAFTEQFSRLMAVLSAATQME